MQEPGAVSIKFFLGGVFEIGGDGNGATARGEVGFDWAKWVTGKLASRRSARRSAVNREAVLLASAECMLRPCTEMG